jgi:hypothetical protein
LGLLEHHRLGAGPAPRPPRLAGTIAWTLLVSSTIEVGLITMQAWRGRAASLSCQVITAEISIGLPLRR